MTWAGLACVLFAAGAAHAEPTAAQKSPGELRAEQAAAAVKEGLIRYYPEKASKAHITGVAVLDCLVDADGYLADCGVIEETPPNYDLGATALAMAPLFRIKAHFGERIHFPIRFRPPD